MYGHQEQGINGKLWDIITVNNWHLEPLNNLAYEEISFKFYKKFLFGKRIINNRNNIHIYFVNNYYTKVLLFLILKVYYKDFFKRNFKYKKVKIINWLHQ